MEVRLAETFIKVAELGNITKSADELGYSQGTITSQIKQLEAELGVQLFDRIGRGIQLSDAGRDFIPYAAALVRASQEADAFAISAKEPVGQISIMAGSSMTDGLLPTLLFEFKLRYPGINVAVQTIDSKDAMIDGLRQNKHNFVFDIGVRRDYPGCIKAAERKEDFVFVCHPWDPIAQLSEVSLEDIFDDKDSHPFIFHGGDETEFSIKNLLTERNIKAASRIEFSSPAAIVRMILQGYGRSLLPRFIVQSELDSGALVEIKTGENIQEAWSQLFYNTSKWVNPAMKAFIDYTQEYFEE